MTHASKYSNYAQFVRGVPLVNEPLTQGEQCLIVCFAINGDWRTCLSHPSMADKMRSCRVGRRQVQRLTDSLITKNLISLATKGNGRGLATEVRINVEDPRFPFPKSKSSRQPKTGAERTREWRERQRDMTKLRHLDVPLPVTEDVTKLRHQRDETAPLCDEKCDIGVTKLRHLDVDTSNTLQKNINYPSTTLVGRSEIQNPSGHEEDSDYGF